MTATPEHSETRRPSPRTAFLLAQLGADAADRFGARVGRLGFSPREAGAIRVIGRAPGISQRELAARLGTVPARLVALLDDLEGRELVSRRRSETDRRNNGLWLTPAGEAALARLRTVAEEHQADVLSPLDDAERAALAGLLQKLSDGSALPRDGHPGYGR